MGSLESMIALIDKWREAADENEFLVSDEQGKALIIHPEVYRWFARELERAREAV